MQNPADYALDLAKVGCAYAFYINPIYGTVQLWIDYAGKHYYSSCAIINNYYLVRGVPTTLNFEKIYLELRAELMSWYGLAKIEDDCIVLQFAYRVKMDAPADTEVIPDSPRIFADANPVYAISTVIKCRKIDDAEIRKKMPHDVRVIVRQPNHLHAAVLESRQIPSDTQ